MADIFRVTSKSRTTTSARRIVFMLRASEKNSIASSILERLRTPAVSMTTKVSPSRSKTTSTASRVVPSISETIIRSSPARWLTRVDLPAVRRPTTAIFISGFSAGFSSGAPGRWSATHWRSSPMPSPFCALITMGSPPTPSAWKDSASTRSRCPPPC